MRTLGVAFLLLGLALAGYLVLAVADWGLEAVGVSALFGFELPLVTAFLLALASGWIGLFLLGRTPRDRGAR